MTNSIVTQVEVEPAINMARQSLYRFAAISLLDPRSGSWEQLDTLRTSGVLEGACAVVRGTDTAKADPLGFGELSLEYLTPEEVFKTIPANSNLLNAEYEHTFGLLVAKACPPYETEYIDGKATFQRSNALADVSGFYRAFGLKVSSQYPERHDHVVLELEFMAFLLGLERQATEEDASSERVSVCREAQKRFFREHLAWWLPAFAKLLSRENSDGFYAALAEFLSAFVAAERALMGVSAPAGPASPSSTERPEECDGCELAS
ncbi:MAG: hypothetical protein CMJ50_02450 [Planctomycetaceae bacterium]|nr:hypothetical protein [Planctomycetaceae bacterium]